MPRKNSTNQSSTMTSWLTYAPLRFALCAFFLPLGLILLYTMIVASIRTPGHPVAVWPMLMCAGIGFIVALVGLIRRLPNQFLDRRSFVAVDTATFITARLVGMALLIIFGLFYFPMMGAFLAPTVNLGKTFLMTMLMIIFGIGGMYIIGVQITALYATYLRARHLGVPRTKILLSLPCSMFSMAGYILDDTHKKNTVTTKQGFGAFVDWIIKSPANAWTILIIMAGISMLFYGLPWGMWPLFLMPVIITALWYVIAGPEKIKKQISGAFGTVAIIVNIFILITILSINFMAWHAVGTQHTNAEIVHMQPKDVQQ